MSENYGKKFEQQFFHDAAQIDHILILRLPDQQSGYYGSSRNICDFIIFRNKKLFFIELKSIGGNTFPFSNFKQFDKMMQLPTVEGVVKGLIVWFKDHNRVLFFDLNVIDDMIKEGLKSININKIDESQYIEIPSVKKRVLMTSDYSQLFR